MFINNCSIEISTYITILLCPIHLLLQGIMTKLSKMVDLNVVVQEAKHFFPGQFLLDYGQSDRLFTIYTYISGTSFLHQKIGTRMALENNNNNDQHLPQN